MNILVFNCGSSSLKYRLIEMPSEKELTGGEAQRVGPPTAEPARIIYRVDGRAATKFVDMPDHSAAFGEVMKLLNEEGGHRVDAIGHRLVHGGDIFAATAKVDSQVLEKLQTTLPLAPIHNPPAVRLVEACLKMNPDLPAVCVFDTAYHSSIPEYARTYALPERLRNELGLRKYGFHGTSHHYVAQKAAEMLNRPLSELNAVSCHLGSGGASLCAIVKGKSVDNTMGFTPLQGLIMSTRCGDLDPAVAMRMLFDSMGDWKSVEKTLNGKSGVLGMYGQSADIRDVLKAAGECGGEVSQQNAEVSRRALEVYVWRIRKYIGAYLMAVGTADAIIFTDTIGETIPQLRWLFCAGLEDLGLKIDPARNANPGQLPADVAADDSRIRALVILTNEELAIARQTLAVLSAGNKENAA